MIHRAAIVLLIMAAAGCAGSRSGSDPVAIRGQVRNLGDPAAALVEVYRVGARGRAERVPGQTVPGADGGFATSPVPRGDYLVVLRLADHPPAYSRARVPGPRIALTPLAPPAGAASIEIRAATSSQTDAACTLVQADAPGPIADRRTVPLRGGAPIMVRGLAAGRWWVDVPAHGASLELVLLSHQAVPERVVVSPPSPVPGAALAGRVTRAGSPVSGVVVAVRPVVEGYGITRTWGRYALTESDGGYRIEGLPGGPVRIRVESHDGPIRLLPPQVSVEIPPSGEVAQDFEIGL